MRLLLQGFVFLCVSLLTIVGYTAVLAFLVGFIVITSALIGFSP